MTEDFLPIPGTDHVEFYVGNAKQTAHFYQHAFGFRPVAPPRSFSDDFGKVKLSSIQTFGETIHTFVERANYNGPFMPGFEKRESPFQVEPIGLKYIDHCVGNVGWGEMDKWAGFYQNVMGFKLLLTLDDKDISTDYTALMSKVVTNGNG